MPPQPHEERVPDGLDEVIDIDAPYERHAPVLRHPGREPQPSRRVPWRPIGLLLAVVAAGAVVVGLADYRPSPELRPSQAPASELAAVTPEPTASEDPSPSLPDGAMPTVGPYWPAQINLPVLTVAQQDVRHADQMPPLETPPGDARTGPYVYMAFFDPDGNPGVIDLGNNTVSSFKNPLKSSEQNWTTQTDGEWLAMLALQSDGSCPKRAPWRLLVAPLDARGQVDTAAGGFSEAARGVIQGTTIPDQPDCPWIQAPSMMLQAGVLAWVQDPVAGSQGSVIHLLNLRAGTERRIKTKHHALTVALSAEAVGWLESPSPNGELAYMGWMPQDGSAMPEWYGMEASLSDPSSAPFAFIRSDSTNVRPPQILMFGSAVVATTFDFSSGGATIVLMRPDGTSEVIDRGAEDRRCEPAAAGDGEVLLRCVWQLTMSVGGNDGMPLAMAAVWTPDAGLRAVTVGQDAPLSSWEVAERGGWAILSNDSGFTAIPISKLTAP
jgi:hypothetical protein